MSAKIEHIIEILEEVRDNFRSRSKAVSVERLRINAGLSVASRRGITNQAVLDTFRRQLEPDIDSTSQFDKLLQDWLLNNSTELRDILLKHRTNKKDEILIRNAFYIASEEEILLAEEFGLDPNDAEFKEGKAKLKIHLVKERNRYLVNLAKQQWLKENNGTVCCAICSFSFDGTYGDVGKGYIEAHHNLPISNLTSETIIKISDLSPVCSNCHSVIHRYRPWLSIYQLKDQIKTRNEV